MPGFLGSYTHQLDAKGRVSLPAPFRRDREGQAFVLIQTQPDALSLYPEDEWVEVQAELRQMSRRNPEYRNLVLGITANAFEVVPDKQGRILIPEVMRAKAKLGSEAKLVGAINRVEIWDPKTFDAKTGQTDETFDRHISQAFS